MAYKTEEKLAIQVFSEDVGWTDILGCTYETGKDQEAWQVFEKMKLAYPERSIRIGHYKFTELANNVEAA